MIDNKITTLTCPYCLNPMVWIAGNPIFTYWVCEGCNKEFEYNIFTETFYDEAIRET